MHNSPWWPCCSKAVSLSPCRDDWKTPDHPAHTQEPAQSCLQRSCYAPLSDTRPHVTVSCNLPALVCGTLRLPCTHPAAFITWQHGQSAECAPFIMLSIRGEGDGDEGGVQQLHEHAAGSGLSSTVTQLTIELHKCNPRRAQVRLRLSMHQGRGVQEHVSVLVAGQGPEAGLQPPRQRFAFDAHSPKGLQRFLRQDMSPLGCSTLSGRLAYR